MQFWKTGRKSLARSINLDLTHAQCHYARFLESRVTSGIQWLEVGCGHQIVPDWAMSSDEQRKLVNRCASLTGIDLDPAIANHSLLTHKVFAVAGSLPFGDAAFDLVSANVVVEHVEDCTGFLADIHRVLKPGGRFVFHTPNYWYYLIFAASFIPDRLKGKMVWLLEKRSEEDRFQTQYRMNTIPQIRRLANIAGFEVEDLRAVGSIGSFGGLGPIGWVECFTLKLTASLGGGMLNSNLLCSLRKR